jgi:hypothetical protein
VRSLLAAGLSREQSSEYSYTVANKNENIPMRADDVGLALLRAHKEKFAQHYAGRYVRMHGAEVIAYDSLAQAVLASALQGAAAGPLTLVRVPIEGRGARSGDRFRLAPGLAAVPPFLPGLPPL